MSHRHLAVITLILVALAASTATASPMPTATPTVGTDLDLAATTVFEDDQEASLGVEASAATGGSVGNVHDAGLATATLGVLAGLSGTATNWVRFVGRASLPVLIGADDETDAADTVGVPRGHHRAAARGTVNFAGSYSGFAVFSDAELRHGGPFGVGIRDASLGPGDFVSGSGEVTFAPRWHAIDSVPFVFQVPLTYHVEGAALLEDDVAARSSGWVRHAFSSGLELSFIPNGGLREARAEFAGAEVGTVQLQPPARDGGPDVRSAAAIDRLELRFLSGDYLIQLERDLMLQLAFGMRYVTHRADTALEGVVERETFGGHVGLGLREAQGTRFHLAYERDATHSADASVPGIGDNRLEVAIAVPTEIGVGFALDTSFSWLDDLGRDDGLEDTRFRMAIDTEAFYTAFDQVDVGVYYQVERNLLLDGLDAAASWNPWAVGSRVNHEVAAFARWHLDVD